MARTLTVVDDHVGIKVDRRGLIGAVLALSVAITLPATVAATQPGVNGRIAFHRGDLGHSQIFSANPDSSHEVQLTDGSDDGANPAWSPDGTRIAFMSARSDPDPDNGPEIRDIYTMRSDGSDVRKITNSVGFQRQPILVPGRPMARVRGRSIRLPGITGPVSHPQ